MNNNVIRTFITVPALIICLTDTKATDADGNHLLIEQIGNSNTTEIQQAGGADNRALVHQGNVPGPSAVGSFLDLDTLSDSFEVHSTGSLSGIEPTAPTGHSVADLLLDLQGTTGGGNNSAKVIQRGSANKALAVQGGGTGNRLVTEQYGNGNIGIHLQENDSNDTELIQRNGGNVNALVARGGVTGSGGGPFTLEAMGNVEGFSIDATGVQPFSQVTVAPNSTGGLTITADP